MMPRQISLGNNTSNGKKQSTEEQQVAMHKTDVSQNEGHALNMLDEKLVKSIADKKEREQKAAEKLKKQMEKEQKAATLLAEKEERERKAAEKVAEREKKQQEKERKAAEMLAEQKEKERKAAERAAEKEKRDAEKAAEKEKKEVERRAKMEAKEAAKREKELIKEEQKRIKEEEKKKKEEEKKKKEEEKKKKGEALSKMHLKNFFSPISKQYSKEDKNAIYNDPQIASFYGHFKPFFVKQNVKMAPINRFQHPVSDNFHELVTEIHLYNDHRVEGPQNASRLPQKKDDPKSYLEEFLSNVNSTLLKKRGTQNMMSIKELWQQRVERPEPASEIDMDTEFCNSATISLDDHQGVLGNDDRNHTEGSIISDFSMGDPFDVLKDPNKIKMKFLKFGEDYRPAYYGTWSKISKRITSRRPFAQDNDLFNYEYDSTAEWEEDEEGEELKSEDDDDDDFEDKDFQAQSDAELSSDSDQESWLVPEGYLSEDEGVPESDMISAESTLSKHLNKKGNKEFQKKAKIVQPLKPIVVGPVFEQIFGDKQHPLAQYGIQILTESPLPIDPFKKTSDHSRAISTQITAPIVIKSKSRSKAKPKSKTKVADEASFGLNPPTEGQLLKEAICPIINEATAEMKIFVSDTDKVLTNSPQLLTDDSLRNEYHEPVISRVATSITSLFENVEISSKITDNKFSHSIDSDGQDLAPKKRKRAGKLVLAEGKDILMNDVPKVIQDLSCENTGSVENEWINLDIPKPKGKKSKKEASPTNGSSMEGRNTLLITTNMSTDV
ncbi:hypothetical protein G9A89_008053 [Geosiphon pyriformis]|nr:hypothetical protein G9A89_008053 [Geosiphon pyriformis]